MSSNRQRYSPVIACDGRQPASRVFTTPGRGAFAMMTSVQSVSGERVIFRLQAYIETLSRASRQPRRSGPSPAQIIAQNSAEDEPPSAEGTPEGAADL